MAESPGKMELVPTTAPEAASFTQSLLDVPLLEWLPAFRDNYDLARYKAGTTGMWERNQMPVLEEDDLEAFKTSLAALNHVESHEAFIPAILLWPSQKQIYFDKAIKPTVEHGKDGTLAFIGSKHLYISEDGFILDGHHRWLSVMLLDPHFKMKVMRVGEKEEKALRDALAYSDANGHERNG